MAIFHYCQRIVVVVVLLFHIFDINQVIAAKNTKRPTKSPTSNQQPHVVILMASEWGWNNVGYHGNKEIMTPFIDHLATKEGVILERFYTFTNSNPTRNSLLTGRLPVHVALDFGQQGSDPRRYNASDPISGYQGIPLGSKFFPLNLTGNC
jgi:hypothetical protein